MRISDWSSDVCSSDLCPGPAPAEAHCPKGCAGRRRHRFHPRGPGNRLHCSMPLRSWKSALPILMTAYIRTLSLNCECCANDDRSEEHTSELQSLMRISYAVFCLKKKNKKI